MSPQDDDAHDQDSPSDPDATDALDTTDALDPSEAPDALDDPDPAQSDDKAVRARQRLANAVALYPEVTDPRVVEAIAQVPRERFMPPSVRPQAFDDTAVPIGHGQTISAPHMVAIMCSILDVQPGHRVLEVGTGSGYHAAVLAWLAGPRGRVWTVETVPTLARTAARHLHAAGFTEVEVHHGDGWEGLPDEAPFDRISVAAASPKVPPPLLEQLAEDGRLVVPVGQRACTLTSFTRAGSGFTQATHGACVFVPLTGAHGKTESDGGSALGWGDGPRG